MNIESYAYSILTTKEHDEDNGVYKISGIASTPTPDRSRDVVNPMGAKFKTPMPLLWQHRSSEPVGTVTMATPTAAGIPFTAEIPKVMESGKLKDRIDEATQSLKYGLVNAVSIGFRALKYNYLEDGGIEFDEWEWMELSLVTIPAQPEAVIQSIKSWDQSVRAASGIKQAELSYYRSKSAATGIRKPLLRLSRSKP